MGWAEMCNQTRGCLVERLSALEYLRDEAERLRVEEPGDGAVLVALALGAFETAVRAMSNLLGPAEVSRVSTMSPSSKGC